MGEKREVVAGRVRGRRNSVRQEKKATRLYPPHSPFSHHFSVMSHATPPVPPGALFYKLLEADGLFEADGLTRSRSVEHECEKLVSLPASLAASNTVAALHSAVASVVPGNPYLQEAELHADSEERLHYLGRALEVRREDGEERRMPRPFGALIRDFSCKPIWPVG